MTQEHAEKPDDAPRSRTPLKDAVDTALSVLVGFLGSPTSRDEPNLRKAIQGLERVKREAVQGTIILGAGGAILTARTLELQGDLEVERAKVKALTAQDERTGRLLAELGLEIDRLKEFEAAVETLVALHEAEDDRDDEEFVQVIGKMRALVAPKDGAHAATAELGGES